MIPLPIDDSIPKIVAKVREHRSLVLVAPPGAGKTTRVPPALLKAGLLASEHPNLIMLQPRRAAARAAAARIAEETGTKLGEEVGYQVRFERRIGPRTRLRVITEGILTRMLLSDPFLEGIGAVLLDEFHERSLHTDLAAAMLREVRQTVRPDLILIVMSATLAAEPIARFLGDCPIVRSEGRTFPIQIEHLPPGAAPPKRAELPHAVAHAVETALQNRDDAGDLLVFLPGADEIRRTIHRLEQTAADHGLLLLPLHGTLSAEQQSAALRPANRQKVVLATNIAETSLTIDGVRTVIDTGLARVASYDPRRGMDRLELKRISLASAAQRAGRAGRTAPGRCLRLWPMSNERAMADFELPEIRRVDLCGTILAVHAWGKTDPRQFGWFEPPDERMLASAERLLAMLGALDAETNGSITSLGRRLLDLPAHPRIGRLIVAATSAGLLEEGATLAALIDETDILRSSTFETGPSFARSPSVTGSSDLLHRMQRFTETERGGFRSGPIGTDEVDVHAARRVARARDELIRIGRRSTPDVKPARADNNDEDELLKLALLAYPDRVARRRGPAGAAVMTGGGGVRLAVESIVRQTEFFVCIDVRDNERSATREALVRIASAIRVEWLEELFPASIRRERSPVYDPERQRVVGRGATWYRDLLLREDSDAPVDPALAGAVLADAIRPDAESIFAADPVSLALLARVRLLRQAMPEHAWPVFDSNQFGDLLADGCRGRRSVEEVRRAGLVHLLQGALSYPLPHLLEQHAPVSIQVPSGNRIALDYTAGPKPVLAVRLQELFGWTDTPRIADGRVPVLLHLLGPNYRPVQITDDLRSFWSSAYFQVRKDLRMRYPKHAWPEDPLSAKAEVRGKRRR